MKVSLSVMFNCYLQKLNKVRFKNVNLVFIFLSLVLTNLPAVNSFEYWHRLAPIPQDAIRLGSDCKSSLQCLLYIPNSQCNWDKRECECQSYHIKSTNNTMCLPGVLLTFDCEIDAQCELKVPNSKCSNGKCICKDNHIKIRFDKCLAPAGLDDYCLNNEMCSSNDPYTHCKWIVPKAYGKCKCKDDHHYSSVDKRCYPRLGHNCFKNSDCEKVTKYSKCGNMIDQKNTLIVVKASVRRKQDKNRLAPGKSRYAHHQVFSSSTSPLPNHSPLKLSHKAKTGYRSASRQSRLTSKFKDSNNSQSNTCRCFSEFKENENKTSCIKDESKKVAIQSSPPFISSSSNSVNQKIIPPFLSLKPNQSLNSSALVLPISIGKKCRNSFECQLRDPYTYCNEDRICDCINKNSKCRIQNTDCYPSTFQCNDGTCISWFFLCDKTTNCPDNSDENQCVRFNCPKESFQCKDGHCITKAWICDGKSDCLDGSDEMLCNKNDCPENLAFQSKNGQCLPLYTFCNAVIDATDKSDEDSVICSNTNSTHCPKGTFQCQNNKCRSTAILCSGMDGCGDNTDENRCHACYCDRPNI